MKKTYKITLNITLDDDDLEGQDLSIMDEGHAEEIAAVIGARYILHKHVWEDSVIQIKEVK